MSNDVPQIAFVLIELTPGKASIGLRFSNTPNRVDILTKYKDMEPKEAIAIIGKMVNREISAQQIADEPYESHPFYSKHETIFKAKYWGYSEKCVESKIDTSNRSFKL